MMARRLPWRSALLAPTAVLLVMGGAMLGSGQPQTPPAGPETVDIALLPDAVRRSLDAFAPSFVASTATRVHDGDSAMYTIVGKSDKGLATTFRISEGGRVARMDQSIDLGVTPPELSNAVAKRFPGAKVTKAEAVAAITYEADASDGKQVYHVTLQPTGKFEVRKDREAEKAKKNDQPKK